MSRVFVYTRASVGVQATEAQLHDARSAGFDVKPQQIIEEIISGSVPTAERPGFQKLMESLESDDVLLVNKMDRLGRNAMDVCATVEKLAGLGVRVYCIALGGGDLTSPSGKITMQVLGAVAEFERDLLVERTQSGLRRAKADGKKLGRPAAAATTTAILRWKAESKTQAEVANILQVSISTVKRHWNKFTQTL